MIIVLTTILVGLPLADAAPPAPSESDEAVAERLHKQALEHARAGNWSAAFPLWDEAQARHANWKYPFNQASGLAHLKRWLAAWRAIERAQAFGVPDARKALAGKLRDTIQAALFKRYAWVEIRVQPAGATITWDGDRYPSPWAGWVGDTQSSVQVAAPGHVTETVAIEHPIGKRTVREVRLRPTPPGP